MPINIVIADDHLIVAHAIRSIIEKFNGFEVLYEVGNGMELIEKFKLKKNIPDIVMLDISMPIMDGFETANWLKENHPTVKIIVLTSLNDDQSFIKMVKAGAVSYLLKNITPEEFKRALNIVCEGNHYYPAFDIKPISFRLTDREKEFLKYCCTEMTYREISEKLFCSPRTVEGYRDSLFEKLNIKTRTALVLYAITNGFCEQEIK